MHRGHVEPPAHRPQDARLVHRRPGPIAELKPPVWGCSTVGLCCSLFLSDLGHPALQGRPLQRDACRMVSRGQAGGDRGWPNCKSVAKARTTPRRGRLSVAGRHRPPLHARPPPRASHAARAQCAQLPPHRRTANSWLQAWLHATLPTRLLIV